MDQEKINQPVIGAIKEVLRGKLTLIASKLLSSEHSKLEDLQWKNKTCGICLTTVKSMNSSLGA